MTWVAPVAQPATTDSVVIATPTTGLDVATAGCKILLIWNKPLPYGVMSCIVIGRTTGEMPADCVYTCNKSSLIFNM